MTSNFYKLFGILTIPLVFSFTTALSQTSEVVLVKSFNLQGSQNVALQLDGPVEVKTWKQDILRVQVTIRLEDFSSAILKSLVQSRRYNLKSLPADNGSLHITMPGIKRDVRIRGRQLQEHLSYTVYRPEHVQVKVKGAVSSSLSKETLPGVL